MYGTELDADRVSESTECSIASSSLTLGSRDSCPHGAPLVAAGAAAREGCAAAGLQVDVESRAEAEEAAALAKAVADALVERRLVW